MNSGHVLPRVERTAVLERRFSAMLRLGLLAILPAALASGCGPSGAKVVPVSGTVTLDEKPAQGIHVTFTPLAEGGTTDAGPGSAGATDAQGRFTLQTAEQTRRSGAVPGKHSVIFSVVTEQAEDDDSIQTEPETMLPERYRDGSMTFEVPADGTDQANFEIQSQ